MTHYELLKINRSILTFMSDNNVAFGDIEYIEIYERYIQMREKGIKVSYIVSCIANEKKMSERAIYNIIGRMGRRTEKAL